MISAALAVLETEEQRNELAEFYKKNKNRLYWIAYSKLHNRESSEDAVQETFLRLAANQELFFRLNNNERVTFAGVVARNVAVDMYKKTNKVNMVELSENILDDDSENPLEDELLYRFTKEKLLEFVRGLPPLQRDVLYLKAVHGLTIQETAAKLSISENVVRQRLFCARQAIKKALRKGDI